MDKKNFEQECPYCGYKKSTVIDWYGEAMPIGFNKEMYFELQCNRCKRKYTHTEIVCNN